MANGKAREPRKQKLLIVDDDEDLRTQMKWALAKDYEVILAEDRETALAAMSAKRNAECVLIIVRGLYAARVGNQAVLPARGL